MPTPAKHKITVKRDGLPDEVVEFNMTWEDIRSLRDAWLMDTDMWMLADKYASLTSQQQEDLTTYREALRNLPQSTTTGLSSDCLLPDKPAWLD